jgi:NADPH:quinone reductase-like Zn-dependent oxidoreductase
VPSNLSLSKAASVPDSFVTAWHSWTSELDVPLMEIIQPGNSEVSRKEPPKPETTFLVWGGATSSGIFAVQVCLCPNFPYLESRPDVLISFFV